MQVTKATRRLLSIVREGEQPYHRSIEGAIEHISQCLSVVGLALANPIINTLAEIYYETSNGELTYKGGQALADLRDDNGHNISNAAVNISLYQMPRTGNYELTWYLS